MDNIITQDLFFHSYAKQLLDSRLCENGWVMLYSSGTVYLGESSEVYHYQRVLAYTIVPELKQQVLANYHPDIEDDQHDAMFIKKGVEPLITVMNFYESGKNDLKQIHINEDFIYFFHLYEEISLDDPCRNYYQYDSGEKKLIIEIKQNSVKIRHQYLTDYLAKKSVDLVIYIKSELNIPVKYERNFDFNYTYTGPQGNTETSDDTISNFSTNMTGIEFQSWLESKRIIPHKAFGQFQSSFDTEYEKFVIGYNTDTCSDVKVSCNDEDHKYNRVFFKKSVLEKYRGEPNATIEANMISMSPFFSLKCDNDNRDYLWTYLKYLQSLPYSEQKYWRLYNIIPKNDPPSEYFIKAQSSFNAQPKSPEYVFRRLILKINEKWKGLFGWPLFKPLTTPSQQTSLNRLYPLSIESEEGFGKLIKTLNLVLSESINVEEFNRLCFHCPTDGSVMKLNYFMESKGYTKMSLVNFLLQINTLRSKYTDTHRNSSEDDGDKDRNKLIKAMKFIGLYEEKRNYIEASRNIFDLGNEAMNDFIDIINNLPKTDC